MGEWGALDLAFGAGRGLLFVVAVVVVAVVRIAVFVLVFDRALRSEDHGSLRSQAHIRDICALDDIQRLVTMLADVVVAVTIVLDQDVIQWVPDDLLGNLLDLANGWREGQQWGRFVVWMTVYWHAAIGSDLALDAHATWDLAAHVRHAGPADLFQQFIEGNVGKLGRQDVVKDGRVALAEGLRGGDGRLVSHGG